jgi:hypothetical protein
MMLFLQLGAMLPGSSRNSIAKISGLISLTSPSIFLGYATYNKIYGAVLFAEKALVVGRLQIAFDPNFFPLTDKSSDNPRYKFLDALLGRGSDALDVAADNAALNDAVSVDLQDYSSALNPPSDSDDAVSADDDDASKALLSELLQSSPVPAFNPLRADPLPANQVPYPAAAPASDVGIKTVAPPASAALLARLASDEVQDAPLRRGARSRKEPSRITIRAVLKSATSGKPLASSRPAVTAQSLAVNKLLLVGRKVKRFFPTLGNFVAKVSTYKPITCKWVLKLKFAYGVYEKHKARIVARGFEQRNGVDYFQSFFPTASQVSFRLVLALTASPGFLSGDLDATSAYIKDKDPHLKARSADLVVLKPC